MQNEHLKELKSPPNDKNLNSNSVLLTQSPAKKEVTATPKQIELKQLSMTTSTSSIESFSKKLDKLSQSQSETQKPQVKKRENIASKSQKLTIKKIDLSSSDEEDFNTNSKTNNSNDF